MISGEEVKKIAGMARIDLSDDQMEKYQAELSEILDFVGQLSKANMDGVEPIRQITATVIDPIAACIAQPRSNANTMIKNTAASKAKNLGTDQFLIIG